MIRIHLTDSRCYECHVRATWPGGTSIALAKMQLLRGVVTDIRLTWSYGEPPDDVLEAVREVLRAESPWDVAEFVDFETGAQMQAAIEAAGEKEAA